MLPRLSTNWLPALAPSITRKTTEKPTVNIAPTRLSQKASCSYFTWWATRRRSPSQCPRPDFSLIIELISLRRRFGAVLSRQGEVNIFECLARHAQSFDGDVTLEGPTDQSIKRPQLVCRPELNDVTVDARRRDRQVRHRNGGW